MKIKEFLIARYGPISYKNKISLTNFNLIWGKNEEGKTLTIDALVKLLLSKNIRDFEYINRVDENPEGYVIIEDSKGKEIKLPEKGDLSKFLDLTPSECSNIFIVRNSNLSITRSIDQESEFYTNVTDHLTGLRTKEISKIKENLKGIGKITPSGAFRDIKDEKLKTKIGNAKDLIGKIENLAKKIKEERFDELEEEFVRRKEEIEGIEQKIISLEDARKREKYETGRKALEKLKESLENLNKLKVYKQEDEQLWRDCENEIEIFNKDEQKTLAELKKNEEEFKETAEKLSETERDFKVFDNRKKKIDDEVKPELKTYKIKSRELVQQEGKSKFFTSVGLISAILFGISLLGVIFSPSSLFYILIVLLLIPAVVSVISRYRFARNKARLAGMFKRISLTLSKFELDAENIEGTLSNIQKFDEEHQKKYDKLQEIKKRKEILDDKISEFQNRTIPDIEKKIKDTEEKINRIKMKSKEESLEKYTKKLKLKQELEKSIGEQKSILKSHFEESSEKLEENISHWDEEIGNLEEYRDRARDVKYSEATVAELKAKKQEFEKKLEKINNRIISFQKEMDEVQRKVNEILQLEKEYLYCQTSADLKAVKDKLQGFIDENESNKGNVLEVMKIFEEIEAEEKEKVSKLFGMDSPITKYFSEITDGLYGEVTFKQGTGKIEIKRKDGKILEAKKLSGGAYDQLYFSIRLALGEKLLKGRKGFFVMDDPFVKADPDRLHRQIEMLKKISELGWQVMYFSAKGEIRNALEEDIQKGTINTVEIQGIFS